MFPLAGSTYPTTADALATSLRTALSEFFEFPNPSAVIRIEGGSWPSFERFIVDMTDATLKVNQPPPKPVQQGERSPGVFANELQVVGHPIRYQESRLDLDFAAKRVKADFARQANGQPMLVISDADEGHVAVQITKADLQAALMAAAGAAAKPHGVAIQDMQLNLNADGPRSVAGDLRVKAKKMVMSGVVHLRGKADIDDQLVATLSNLACGGEGMIGGMAAAMVNTKLKTFEGKRIALSALALGDVKLRDVKISTTDAISVTAQFGKQL